MVKRSPRYPRHGLSKAIEMTRKLFDGAHQSKIDVDAAAKVLGYTSSGSGAASSALGALRQFGLVDGLRGDVAVSDLAMRIIEPMNSAERYEAFREASRKPEIFARVYSHFNDKVPSSDEAIRSFLIRQEGFSPSGANELIAALRDTAAGLPAEEGVDAQKDAVAVPASEPKTQIGDEGDKNQAATRLDEAGHPELIRLPLGQGCRAELRMIGDVSAASYSRLIKHLELLWEIAIEEAGG